jgi:hypothetical protein
MLPVLERQPGLDEMIEGKYYFILHAPRQSGKTTLLQFYTNQIICLDINGKAVRPVLGMPGNGVSCTVQVITAPASYPTIYKN